MICYTAAFSDVLTPYSLKTFSTHSYSADRFELLCIAECVFREEEVNYFTVLIRQQCPGYLYKTVHTFHVVRSGHGERQGHIKKSTKINSRKDERRQDMERKERQMKERNLHGGARGKEQSFR